MGSAQSARRIQPGGASGRAGGPADLSRSPFLPTPPPARLPSPPALAGGRRRRGRAGGAGGGAGGGPPPGRRAAAAGRISTAAVRRDRLRDGWEGRRGRWPGGRPARSRPREVAGAPRAGPHPPGVTAPRQQRSPNPGAEGDDRRRALPPPGAHPRGVPREGARPAGARRCRGGRAAPPTARPPSHPPPPPPRPATGGRAGRGGGADCPQCAPGGSRRRARGFLLGATP